MGSGIVSEFNGTERFEIQQRLGSGSFGVVYQAFDRERNAIVALKTLRLDDAKALYRFKREFRAIADVTHPNLVTLYELISNGEQWLLTMELVQGVPFLEYVCSKSASRSVDPVASGSTLSTEMHRQLKQQNANTAAPSEQAEHRVDIDKLRASLRQLTEGILALHKAGKLHCDIKPSNVLVTPEGRVVILDFGLVTELTTIDLNPSAEFVGTPNYMSPEQCGELTVSEASDWYSVGVMLYEALTGELPFTGRYFEILTMKQQFEPRPPNELVFGLPDDLTSLCVDLLRLDASQRANGRDILLRLGERKRSTGQLVDQFAVINTALVGRERHINTLKDALNLIKKGKAAAVCLYGSSGMGKSDLVKYFIDELQESDEDLVTLMGRCYEQESVPYKALDSLIDALTQYLRRLPTNEAEALLPKDVMALARLFPVFKQIDALTAAERKVLDIPDSQELRRRAFLALRELFFNLARKKPLIAFIDDLHWGDSDSAALLCELTRHPAPPFLLIASYRSEDARSNVVLRALISHMKSATSGVELRELAVGELDFHESLELAQELMGEAGSLERAEAIARESGGNPFFIDALARYAKAYDQISPATLDEVLRARVLQLPEEARRLLELVAVAGQPLPRTVAKRAARLESDELPAITLLKNVRLIRYSGVAGNEKLEAYHDRIRETILKQLELEQLTSYHYLLAVAFETYQQADAETIAHHFIYAGDQSRAAHYSALAADQASEALAFESAAKLYKTAIELGIAAQLDGARINALRMRLGDALANAGRGVEAAAIYLEAARESGAADTLELQRKAAEQYLISGHTDEGFVILRNVLARVGMKLPESPQQALLSFLYHRAVTWLRGWKFKERNATCVSAEDLLRIDVCWSVALGLGIVDTIRGLDFQARHLLLALKAGEPYRIARALCIEVAYSAAGGERKRTRTEKLHKMAQDLTKRINQPYMTGLATLFAGEAAFLEGRFKLCDQLCRRAETILREKCTGTTWELDTSQLFSLRALYSLGKLHELSVRLPLLLKEAQERGDLYAETSLHTRIGYVPHLANDAPDTARYEESHAIEKWPQKGFQAQHYFTLVGNIEINLYIGDNEGALKLLEEQWSSLKRSLLLQVQFLRLETLHMRARAYLAMAAGSRDKEPLLKLAQKDSASIERENAAWARPMALLLRAGIAVTRRDFNSALELLAKAETGFNNADMLLYETAARRRRGELLGGNQGEMLIGCADLWMKEQKIKNPAKMTNMLAPGKWSE